MPNKPAHFQFDNLDDRSEIHRMLQLLHPVKGVQWLEMMCKRCKVGPKGEYPRPRKNMWDKAREAALKGNPYHFRLATEIYFDLWDLANQYGLDLAKAILDLRVRMKSKNFASPS